MWHVITYTFRSVNLTLKVRRTLIALHADCLVRGLHFSVKYEQIIENIIIVEKLALLHLHTPHFVMIYEETN